ncbi:hypothetical protein V6Z11_D12G127200 [Gossypium hirsutum]
MLRGMGSGNNFFMFLASGKIYNAEKTMASLVATCFSTCRQNICWHPRKNLLHIRGLRHENSIAGDVTMFGLDGAREAKGSLEMARGTVSARTTTAKLFQTSSYPPAVAATKAVEVKGNYEKMASAVGKESFKKRKAEKLQNSKVVTEESKRIKACEDEGEESKITGPNTNKSSNNKKEASGDASKENSKVSEVQKPDFIHVRARRGQATDSH